MEKTFEEKVSELESRMGDVLDAIFEAEDTIIGKAYADAELISCEAMNIAWDDFSHDPRYGDDCPVECDDLDAIYHEAKDTAQKLMTLKKIMDALF